MRKAIRFYLPRDAHGEFSNFAPYPIEIDSKIWPTSEHYFQSQKFAGTVYEEQVRLAGSPMKAVSIGRDRNLPLRADWNEVRVEVMRTAIKAKFSQYPELRAKLISTGNLTIVEHTTADTFWGDGGNGHGQNMLGKILMEERSSILSQ